MQDPVAELERQLRSGWARLRFTDSLEPDFREHYERQQIRYRLILILIGIVLIVTTPLVDAWLMHPPAEFARITHALQLSVMTPVTLLALIITAVPRLRRFSPQFGVLTILTIAGGVIYQRRLGAQYEYFVPTELGTVVIAGGFVLGGLRFWRTLPWALQILIVIGINEIATFGYNSASLYATHVSAMQVLIAGTAGYLQEYHARGNWLRHGLLKQIAIRDPLTGLLNSREFQERCRQTCWAARRDRHPVLVAILDVDCFKEFNDSYGHAAGDHCLTEVARTIVRVSQQVGEIQARIGGEEFAVVCQGIGQPEALQLLESLRQQIEALKIPHNRSRVASRVVTTSIGAIWFIPDSEGAAEEALRIADQRLYRSKQAGRNRICFVGDVIAGETGGVSPAAGIT